MGCISSKVSDELPEKTLEHSDSHYRSRLNAGLHNNNGVVRDDGKMDRLKALTILNDKVEKELAKENTKQVQKALFLGTGESGKSTVFKQMRLCYGSSFDEFERNQYSKLIWADTLRAIRILVDMCVEERRCVNGDKNLYQLVTDWLGDDELGTDPNNVKSSVQLIKSLDLTRQNFLEQEMDTNARSFLHNHVRTGRQQGASDIQDLLLLKDPEQPDSPKALLSQAMSGLAVPDPEESTFGSTVEPPVEIEPTRANITDAVSKLWSSCPNAIKTMVIANRLGLETNAAFFLDRISRLRDPNFVADDEDILHARIKTTGITTAQFNVKSNNLIVMDVGGQRVERRKWIHSFDDVSCILFVASVSEYDQGLEEDSSINRLEEALEVFNQTVNSQWFRAKSVQLFLNKTDILETKCHYSSFKACFPKYRGNDNDPAEIIRYIEGLFRDRFKAGNRNLYIHQTCATDRSTMRFVIDAVSDMILYENLKWAGMI